MSELRTTLVKLLRVENRIDKLNEEERVARVKREELQGEACEALGAETDVVFIYEKQHYLVEMAGQLGQTKTVQFRKVDKA